MIACIHLGVYLCDRCSRCYACQHVITEEDRGYFWRCPDGFRKRALPERALPVLIKWWEIDPEMNWYRLWTLYLMGVRG